MNDTKQAEGSTPAFTPGPWVADGLKVEGSAEKHMHDIAFVECFGVFDKGCEEAKANAHLIAAAPAMYDALEAAEQCIKDLLEVYRNGGSMLVLDEAVKSLRGDALASVHVALEAARGGSNG